MPSLINSDDGVVSGSAGLKTTGSNDGILALQNNGTTNVTVTAAGNVGIGTSSPSARLEVFDTSAAAATALVQLTGQNNFEMNVQSVTSTNSTVGARYNFVVNSSNGEFSWSNSNGEQARITSAGLFQFNSGYGSVATAYGCRAWVNFDGTSNTANLSGTYSQSGTTVTVTATAHGLIAGNVVYSDITTGTGVDGTYTVATVTDANTFTYTAGTSLTTSGNVTLRRNTIRASGNVSSVADNNTGDYTVNFSIAMPDANYSTQVTGPQTGATNGVTYGVLSTGGNPATGSVRVINGRAAGALDSDYVNVAIFR